MTITNNDWNNVQTSFLSTGQAAKILGIDPLSASRLVRQGKIPGVKIGRFYVVSRESVEGFAKGYEPRTGRPRTKRKYTKRSPKWFQ